MTQPYPQPELPPAGNQLTPPPPIQNGGPFPPPLAPHPFVPPPAKNANWWVWPLIAVVGLIGIGSVASSLDLSPAGLVILIVVFGVPVALTVLIVRALIRVGDKRPTPVVIAPPPMMPPPVAAPPPGFYPDQAGVMRWFDGQKWTEFTQ